MNRLATSILLGLGRRRWIEFEDFRESVSEVAYLLEHTIALSRDDIAREVCELLFRCDGIGEVWCDDDLIVAYVAQRLQKKEH